MSPHGSYICSYFGEKAKRNVWPQRRMHPLALRFLVFLDGGSLCIVNQVCLSQRWVLLSGGDGGRRTEKQREGGRGGVPDLTFLSDACTSCAAGSAVPLRRSLLHGNPSFHRIILGMPLERLLLFILCKQYCLRCNIHLDSSSACIYLFIIYLFQLNSTIPFLTKW